MDTNLPLKSTIKNDEAIVQTLPIFVRHLKEAVTELETLLRTDQWKEIQRTVHNLKGSSASFGFPTLATTVSELEEESKSRREVSVCQEILDRIVRLTGRIELGIGN